MNWNKIKGRGICYSGFRDGQQPGGVYPTYVEIKEDLQLLEGNFYYLRLYDVGLHAETVLQVIEKEQFDFKVMLGAYIEAEANNPNCPWGSGVYSEEALQKNRKSNAHKIDKLIELANLYPTIIDCLSVGNEACVDWTDHLVPVEKVIEYTRKVHQKAKQPVTFCENYVPWLHGLEPLAKAVDFISIHTYPVWEYKNIHEALDYTKQNFNAVAQKYPNKPIVITEAGWATKSNGRGIPPQNVNDDFQIIYFIELFKWAEKNNLLIYFFEAFDENWKGSPDPLEPEKHWGIYHADRSPKKIIKTLQTNLIYQNH